MHARRTHDLDLIRALDCQCLGSSPEMKDATLEASDWWVVDDAQGDAVAYAGLYTGIKGEGWLVRAGVLAEARGHRLQRKLIQLRLRRARALALPRVLTYTMSWNIASNKNLAACGLVPYRNIGEALYWYWKPTS